MTGYCTPGENRTHRRPLRPTGRSSTELRAQHGNLRRLPDAPGDYIKPVQSPLDFLVKRSYAQVPETNRRFRGAANVSPRGVYACVRSALKTVLSEGTYRREGAAA